MESESVLHDIAVAFLEFIKDNPGVPVLLQVELEGMQLELEYRAHLLEEPGPHYERHLEVWPEVAGV